MRTSSSFVWWSKFGYLVILYPQPWHIRAVIGTQVSAARFVSYNSPSLNKSDRDLRMLGSPIPDDRSPAMRKPIKVHSPAMLSYGSVTPKMVFGVLEVVMRHTYMHTRYPTKLILSERL